MSTQRNFFFFKRGAIINGRWYTLVMAWWFFTRFYLIICSGGRKPDPEMGQAVSETGSKWDLARRTLLQFDLFLWGHFVILTQMPGHTDPVIGQALKDPEPTLRF